MTNEEKAREIQANDVCCVWNGGCPNVRSGAMKMAQWKDEQLEQTRKDAKELHDEISDCIDRLVKSRLSKDGIKESNALQQMESLMVQTQQFLQTI